MTDHQWNQLLAVVQGKALPRPPIGFIIDCPWLPNWFGADILDYLTSEELWFEANRKAIETFPEVIFLPGFWSEFGMCTEPSAFGAKCVFPRNEFPFAEKVIRDVAQIDDLAEPNPATDGLLPFMLNRLKFARPRIEALGHKIRFSVSRGPLNIATFLMGTTEFLMALKTDPDKAHKLLRTSRASSSSGTRCSARRSPPLTACSCWTTSSASSARRTSGNSACLTSRNSTPRM